MYHPLRNYLAFSVFIPLTLFGNAHADGIVNKVVSSPLSVVGAVQGERTGINIYLQNNAAPGMAFINPEVIGYGIAPGGRLEVVLEKGFRRDQERKLDSIELRDLAIILVTGTPQQGLLGKKAGYEVAEGETPYTFAITPTKPEGMPAEKLMSGAPGAKRDPMRYTPGVSHIIAAGQLVHAPVYSGMDEDRDPSVHTIALWFFLGITRKDFGSSANPCFPSS